MEITETLHDRLMMWVSKYNIDLADAQMNLTLILKDFKIEPKETALQIYTEGKNVMFLKKFILAKAIAGCSERTIRIYKQEIEKFLQVIGKDADTITPIDIQAFIANRIVNGNSKSYVDTLRRYLSSFFGYLSREDLIAKNPMAKIEKIKYHTDKEEAFTDYDIEKIRGACKNAREKAIIELLLSTGCRASEVCGIKITDIEDDAITVFGKGGKFRKVYLNAKAVVAIQHYLSERKDKNPYLFPRGIDPTQDKALMGRYRAYKGEWYRYLDMVDKTAPMDKETINSVSKKIGKRAGVDNVHTHRFRRTCATMALRRGMTIELVSKMLGHEQIATTQIYLDLREEDLKIAHEKFVY
jgi:site-specific recombinase XerD